MLTSKYLKVVKENMMQFLSEENMVPSNFDRAEELSALLVKKTIFPYNINDRDLDREYETCPPIKRFADNVLKKSKMEEEEIQKLTPAYENVKKMWNC